MTDPRPLPAGTPHQVRTNVLTLRGEPSYAAPHTSQLLFGESFFVEEERDGWALGTCGTDLYRGWAPAAGLSAETTPPTHRVTALRSFVFPRPTFKAPASDHLSLNSPVAVVAEQDGYALLATGGWVYAKHLSPLDAIFPDHVATAQRLLGVPYLWGGRSSLGIDCSGLVQLSLGLAGHGVVRDTKDQKDSVGTLIGESLRDAPPRRGDLVYMPGHVGIALDAETMLHANSFHMAVTIDPIHEVEARNGKPVWAVRRI
ncbi:MAG TPA: NlpC/P60 family protein [Alphaproteobacteria bacterium]|nr:NlpC/P60 family protein [Alphaproteobacteria bacterium]